MNQKYFLIPFLFFLTAFTADIYAQPEISGIINAYSKVDSVFPTKDTLIVTDPSLFNNGDTVMIYQAKGADAYVGDDLWETIGRIFPINDDINSAGKYEIIIVDAVIPAEKLVVLRVALANQYDPEGLVQLIRVPSYNNVRVTGTLTCDPWDGEKGGVLVLFANDTIYLEADMNVSGKGFNGANPVLSQGVCSNEDSAYFQQYVFHENSDSVGRKGEGVVKDDSLYAKGISPWGNGGGGGNARFAGGGGGGNYVGGGFGGKEDTISCGPSPAYLKETEDTTWEGLGGRGAQGIGQVINDSTIFLGGGGGSGTYTSDLYAARGGSGGGIIIVLGKFLVGNNHKINANGEDVTDVATAAGAGGGAGGTIVFDVDSVQTQLKLWVNGGKGGDTEGVNLSGPGGGGGAGKIFFGNFLTTNISPDISGGTGGNVNDRPLIGKYGATDGNDGNLGLINDLPLTGFLFNSISANHAVCSGDAPNLISGSNPRGGDGNFTYSWEFKTNSTDWSTIPGASSRDLQPDPLTDTTYYRRIVESAGIIDISAPIKVVVHEWIIGNQIFPDDTITCIGNEADTITGTTVQIGGDGSYSYFWQSSFDQNNWNAIDLLNDTVCLPGIVVDTTFIRRVVNSGACYDTSRNVEIIGLPQIDKNTLDGDQEICYGQIPEEIIGEQPVNGLGSGSYVITWQSSADGLNWNTITDSSRLNFAPSNLIETTYYRRMVASDDCMDISDSVKINVLPLIDNNLITNNATIFTCYNTEPEILSGSEPTGGDNEYHYQWIKSTDGNTWAEITENGVNKNYQPGALTEPSYYKRIVRSGQDSCCVDTSNMITVNIYPLPIASIDNIEDTVCSGEEILLNFTITSGQQPFNLTFSNGESLTTINNISDTETIYEVYPATDFESKVYNYTIDSVSDANGCVATDLSGETEIVVYGWPETDPGTDTQNCDLIHQMDAGISLGEGIWTQIDGQGNTNFDNIAQATTELSVNSSGIYQYQWKETNWKCADSAQVEIYFYLPLDTVIAGEDAVLNFETEYLLTGYMDDPDEDLALDIDFTLSWEEITDVLAPSDKVPNGNKYDLDNLSSYFGSELKCVYTVTKGVCDPVSDTVIITINDIFVPENIGFTPNGDDVHDYLQFHGLERAESNELIIFNRWGTEVYRKVNFSNDPGWDGRNMDGNELPDDTYYWILHYTKKNGDKKTEKGFVVIKR